MPGLYYANPYTVQTPIGAGLQNIAMALFKQRAADEHKSSLQDQQGGMYAAHGDLYRATTAKTNVERKLAERLLRDQGPDAQDELIAAASGVPTYTVRGYRDTMQGANPGRTMEDYADVAPGIRRGMLAVRPAYADKTINPVNIAQALDQLGTTDTRNDVIAGKQKASDVAAAFYATSGKAPYAGSETGSTNLLTGGQTLNEIGTGRAAREQAHAGEYSARARQLDQETRSGIKLGPPVVVDDPEVGTMFTSPSAAVGRRPGLNPNSPGARPTGRGDGSTTTENPIRPHEVKKQDADLLLGGIDRAVGGELGDRMVTGAIMKRAQDYFTTPGSPHYGQHEAAARAAVADVLPTGASENFFGSKFTPKGQPVTDLPPIAAIGPTTTKKTVTKGAPSTGQPASSLPAPQSVGRPGGKSDQQLITEANDALRKGAPREQVLSRLKAWGVQVD